MNISTIDNTLQNYITKYIEQTFATHVSGNRYDKLYRELLSGIEKIIKLTINEAKHYDKSLENLYNDSRFIALFTIIRTDRNMLLACYSHKHISYHIRTITRKAIIRNLFKLLLNIRCRNF